MNKTILAIVVVVLVGIGAYFLFKSSFNKAVLPSDTQQATSTNSNTETATTSPQTGGKTVLGTSVGGNDITAYHFGSGPKEILFIGDIHGGYEWNTALVAFELIDYLTENPNNVPSNETVTVIPVLNPDGLDAVVGSTERFSASDVPSPAEKTIPGRFNGHTVDLNRNFDCDWKSTGVWQSRTVSGGSKEFSEPESQAIKNYVEAHKPVAVVAWYSSAGGVYASSCHDGVLPETQALTELYAKASGYPAYKEFDFYAITGDMVNWLAKEKIPAISVLLTNHSDTEWSKNQKGIDAVLQNYAQ